MGNRSGILVAGVLVVLCAFAPARALTLSSMMCVGNGCPDRVYAYHKCSSGFIWSARTHRCVRRVRADTGDDKANEHDARPKRTAPQP